MTATTVPVTRSTRSTPAWRVRFRPRMVHLWWGILALTVVLAIFGQAIAPFDHELQAPADRLLEPLSTTDTGRHLFGTDALGRDLLSKVIVGTRLTLIIGILATFVGTFVGTLVGVLCGYYGGWTDRIGMRLAEAQTAMPMFLVAILLLSLLGPTVVNLLIVLPTLIWPTFARIMRAETLRLKESPFVEAAQVLGCSGPTIVARHLVPNLLPRIGALVVIEVGHVMLAEAGLSFLGVGVQPPDITWGLLISEGRQYLAVAWWVTILPGICLGIVVLAMNMLGRHFEKTRGAAG